MISPRRILVAAALAFSTAAWGAEAPRPTEPSITASSPGPVTAARGMVAAENVLAARVGAEILAAGGNAVDAAVGTALAIGVVNPTSCGIGGGGFALVWDAKSKSLHALDFREMAPKGAGRDFFLKDGEVEPSWSLRTGRAVAVPGEVPGLAALHAKLGSLSFAEVVGRAAALARDGFPAGEHLVKAIERRESDIAARPALARILLGKGGKRPRVGDTLRFPDLAATLRRIAEEGPSAMTEGTIAEGIATTVREHGGVMTAADIAAYEPVWREPLVLDTPRGKIAGFPPPSSGGGVVLAAAGILGRFEDEAPNATVRAHRLAEALKLTFRDRAIHYGDPDHVDVPMGRLLSPERLDAYRARIRDDRRLPSSNAATLPETGGTSHLSVIDRFGNAVALTSTINTTFGSMIAVPGTGVILNNEMDDFSAAPGEPNVYGLVGSEANAIAPRKRPLSSMSPTLVFDGDRVRLAVGGSGGPRIISATLQVALRVLEGDSVDRAVSAPRIHHQWLPDVVFVDDGTPDDVRAGLEALGHRVQSTSFLGAVQAVVATDDGFIGMADPGKGGGAAGW